MKYKYLIFDADDTLLDYKTAEINSNMELMKENNITFDDNTFNYLWKKAWEQWNAIGLHQGTDENIQKTYHSIYRQFRVNYFDEIKKVVPYTKDSKSLAQRYIEIFSTQTNLLPEAENICSTLSKHYNLALATNGLKQIQNGRLKTLERYFKKIYISEDVGFIKPSSDFFNFILRDLNVKASDCLMIGDSLSSDIAGANAINMDSCWYNPSKVKNNTHIKPTYEIHDLKEVFNIINK